MEDRTVYTPPPCGSCRRPLSRADQDSRTPTRCATCQDRTMADLNRTLDEPGGADRLRRILNRHATPVGDRLGWSRAVAAVPVAAA